MSSVVVMKSEDGKLEGFGEKGRRAYERFRRYLAEMAVGETMSFAFHMPRSPQQHKLFFATLGGLFARQEQFADVDRLRMWLTVGAGYCDLVPGPSGRMVAMPQSIAWERMDDSEFKELFRAVDDFLWTTQARRFLWPHLSDDATHEQVANLLMEYRR